MANDFLSIVDHSDTFTEFAPWLKCKLEQIVDSSLTCMKSNIDREKLWVLFHQMRVDASLMEAILAHTQYAY